MTRQRNNKTPEPQFMPLIDCVMPEDYERGCKDQRKYCADWLYKYLKRFESPSRVSGDVLCMDSEHWESVRYHLKRIASDSEGF